MATLRNSSKLNPLVLWSQYSAARPSTLSEYIVGQRRLNKPLSSQAQARIAALAAVRPPSVRNAIQSAGVGGEALASIGGAFGAIGHGVGYALGTMGGFALGIWPSAKQDAIEAWKQTVELLTPLERFGVLVASYPVVRRALQQEHESPQPAAFRWGTDPLLGHTAWGGPVSNVVFMFEAMWEVGEVVPDFSSGNTAYEYNMFADWLLAFVGGFHDNEKTLADMRHAWPLLRSGKVSASLAARLRGNTGGEKLGAIRARLAERGISLWNPPVIPSLRNDLVKTYG